MRTTVTLDDDVYEAVIQISALSGERPGKILSRLVRKGLNPEPAAHLRTGRFPQFSVPATRPSSRLRMFNSSSTTKASCEPAASGRQLPFGVGVAESPVSHHCFAALREFEREVGDVRDYPTWIHTAVLESGLQPSC